MKKLGKSIMGIVMAVVIVVTALAVCAKIGIELYRYNHPDIRLHYMHPSGEDFNVQYFGMSTGGGSSWFVNKNGNPYALRFDLRKREWTDKVYAFQNQLYADYVGPADIKATVENLDGHTVFTYQGTATSKTGVLVVIDERIVLDSILTEYIPDQEE